MFVRPAAAQPRPSTTTAVTHTATMRHRSIPSSLAWRMAVTTKNTATGMAMASPASDCGTVPSPPCVLAAANSSPVPSAAIDEKTK